MDSTYIKACVCAYMRFSKGARYVATEVGRFSSDVLAIANDKLIEIEIKTSKSDLTADFRKDKHRIYETGKSKWTPSQFYFAVPPDLVEHAIAKCVDKPYGVMMISDGKMGTKTTSYWAYTLKDANKRKAWLEKNRPSYRFIKIENKNDKYFKVWFEYDAVLMWKERVKVIKRAKIVHKKRPDRQIHYSIVSRLSSEMSNLRIDQEGKKNEVKVSK